MSGHLPDADARLRARNDLASCLLVEAGAGSGKTSLIVARMVQLVATGRAATRQIAAVTFTIRAAAELRGTHPTVGVVVLSQYLDPGYATALLAAGSAGRAYLLKERVSEPGQLADAVRTVAAQGSVIDPAVVDVLVAASTRQRRSPVAARSA